MMTPRNNLADLYARSGGYRGPQAAPAQAPVPQVVYDVASKMGFAGALPPQQAAPPPASPRITPQNSPQTSGYAQQQMGPGNPNQQQMSPQLLAMIQQMRERAAMNPAQQAIADRGVFAGSMQPAQMAAPPQMTLPQLYAGGR